MRFGVEPWRLRERCCPGSEADNQPVEGHEVQRASCQIVRPLFRFLARSWLPHPPAQFGAARKMTPVSPRLTCRDGRPVDVSGTWRRRQIQQSR